MPIIRAMCFNLVKLARFRQLAAFLDGNASTGDFWQRVKTNLQAGKVRLLFVSDAIPLELRRIVEFLNEQVAPAEVLAVEIRQCAGKSLKTLVPRVLEKTTALARRGKEKRRRNLYRRIEIQFQQIRPRPFDDSAKGWSS